MRGNLVCFAVRMKNRSSIEEIGARTERILRCTFGPVDPGDHEGVIALEAEMLGLTITLATWSRESEEELHTVQPMGNPTRELLGGV